MQAYKDLKSPCEEEYFCEKINAFGEWIAFFILTVVICGGFLLSRLFSMFFPIIAIIYFDIKISDIELLQWILTSIYFVLIISWIIAAINCIKFYHWTSHLFPNRNGRDLSQGWQGVINEPHDFQFRRLNLIQTFYNKRCNEKYLEILRKEIVIDILGKDIGGLIISYWAPFEFQPLVVEMKAQYWELATEFRILTDDDIDAAHRNFRLGQLSSIQQMINHH